MLLQARKEARLLKELEERKAARASEIFSFMDTLAKTPSTEDLELFDVAVWSSTFPRRRAHLEGLPSMTALIEDDATPVTLERANSQLGAITADLRVYRMRVRHNLANLQRDILSEKQLHDFHTEAFEWFKPVANEDLASLESEDKINIELLLQPTCIFAFRGPQIAMYPFDFDDATPLATVVKHSREVQSVARRLMTVTGIEGKTLAELNRLGETFACASCPAEASSPLIWTDLVSASRPLCRQFEALNFSSGATYP